MNIVSCRTHRAPGHRLAFMLAVVLLTTALAACSSGVPSSTGGTGGSSTGSGASSAAPTYGIGDTAVIDQWEFALVAMDTATPLLSNPSGRVWSFTFEVRNARNESRALGTGYKYELADDHGAIYKDASRGAGFGLDSPDKVITPRDTLQLVVLFDVASDARPQSLKILENGLVSQSRAVFDVSTAFAYATPTVPLPISDVPQADIPQDGDDTSTAPSTPLAPAAPVGITYAEIVQQYQALSADEWDKYRLSLIGQNVIEWHGWVDVVRKQITTGKWELKIDLDSPDKHSLSWEVRTIIPATDAEHYQDEQELVFSGSISDVSCIAAHCNVDLVDSVFQSP